MSLKQYPIKFDSLILKLLTFLNRRISDVFWEAISSGNVLSLYQGLGTKNVQSFVSSFIYFYSYSYFKRLHSERIGSKSIGTTANLLIAAASAAFTNILTQPLDTASSRMQTSEFGNAKGFWKTLTEGTWGDAYDGMGITLLLTPNPAIQYTVFDQLKQNLVEKRKAKAKKDSSPVVISSFMAFLLGAISKSAATVITYPLIRYALLLIQTLLVDIDLCTFMVRCKVMIQAADDTRDNEAKKPRERIKKTIPGVIYAIWEKEGALGFFKGLQAQILKTVLSSALLLMIKEKITATTWFLILAIRKTLFVTKGRLKSS
ncbi:hypothetical protein DY000_02011226 [Brassica cretica]|uniref:Peroxisomal adenine nucleotide carrier 1 n=1 Tax=Brassica cretica TaxID=69181 RepID=A0ABQ7DAE2_BRACR|nr:hypothetical protein DY000_02011226 [Brassica cretica]